MAESAATGLRSNSFNLGLLGLKAQDRLKESRIFQKVAPHVVPVIVALRVAGGVTRLAETDLTQGMIAGGLMGLTTGAAIGAEKANQKFGLNKSLATPEQLINGGGDQLVPTLLYGNPEDGQIIRKSVTQLTQELNLINENSSSYARAMAQLEAAGRIVEINQLFPNQEDLIIQKNALYTALRNIAGEEQTSELIRLKNEQLEQYLSSSQQAEVKTNHLRALKGIVGGALVGTAAGIALAVLPGLAEGLEHLGGLAEQLQIHHGPQTDTTIPKLTETAHAAPITHPISEQEHIVSVSPAQPTPDSSHLQTVEPPLTANSNHLNLMGSPNIEAIYDNGGTLGPSNSTIELKDFTGIPSHPEQFASPSPDEQQLHTSVITNPDGSQGIKLTYDGHHVPNSSTWFQCWEKSPAVKGPEQTPSILARLVDNTGKPIEKNQFDFNPNDKSHFVEIANPNNPNETRIVSLDDFTKLTLNQDELKSYIDSGAVGTEYGHAAVFNGAITVVDIDQDGEITGHATVSIEQQGFNADQSLQTYESAPPGTSAGLTPEQQGDQEMISADSTTDLSEKITHYETAGTDYEKAGDYPKAASAFEKAGNSAETIGSSWQYTPDEKVKYYTEALNDYKHAARLESDDTKKADDLSKAENAQKALDALKQPPVSQASTPEPTTTQTAVATATLTPEPTNIPNPTDTPEPSTTPLAQTATNTPTPTPTETETETETPTSTPTPPEPTATQTAEATEISTATALPIISEGSPINGSIETSTPTPIPPTHTPTAGTTFESTATPVSTATPETDKLSHIQEGAPPENTGLLDRIRVDKTTIGLAGLSAISALTIRTALNKKWGPPRNIKEEVSDRIKSFGLPTIAFALVGAGMGTRMGVPIGAEAIAAGIAGIAGAGLETTGAIAVGLGKKTLGRFKKIPTPKLSTQPSISIPIDTKISEKTGKEKKRWTRGRLAGTILVTAAALLGINKSGTINQHANTIKAPQGITTPTLQPKPSRTPISTNTKIPTRTRTVMPTLSPTRTSTFTRTSTPSPTKTATSTKTPTPTLRPTFTHTLTPTPSPRTTATATATFENAKTIIPTATDVAGPLGPERSHPAILAPTHQPFVEISPQLLLSENDIAIIKDTLQPTITKDGQVKLYADKNKTREILVVHPKKGNYKGFIDVGATIIYNRISLTAPENSTLLMDGMGNFYQHIVYKTKDGKIIREDLINYPYKYDQAQKDFADINQTASYAQNFHIEPTSHISDRSAVKLYYGSKDVSEFIVLDKSGKIDFVKILKDLRSTNPNMNISDSVKFTFNPKTGKAFISTQTGNMQAFIAIDNPNNLSLPNPTPVPPSTTLKWSNGKTAGITPLPTATETPRLSRTLLPSFPRLATIYSKFGFDAEMNTAAGIDAISRYGLHVTSMNRMIDLNWWTDPASKLKNYQGPPGMTIGQYLKFKNPDQVDLMYQHSLFFPEFMTDTINGKPYYMDMHWFLTYAGSDLKNNIDKKSTSIPVNDLSKFQKDNWAIIGGGKDQPIEMVWIKDVSGKSGSGTLTVERGIVAQVEGGKSNYAEKYPAVNHTNGEWVRMVVMAQGVRVMNMSNECPTSDLNPSLGSQQTYNQFMASFWKERITKDPLYSILDGMFLDNLIPDPNDKESHLLPKPNPSWKFDYENKNKPLTSKMEEKYYLTGQVDFGHQMRKALKNKIIVANTGGDSKTTGQDLNGGMVEGLNATDEFLKAYNEWMQGAVPPQVYIVNASDGNARGTTTKDYTGPRKLYRGVRLN